MAAADRDSSGVFPAFIKQSLNMHSKCVAEECYLASFSLSLRQRCWSSAP
jgi:hypothetical protein